MTVCTDEVRKQEIFSERLLLTPSFLQRCSGLVAPAARRNKVLRPSSVGFHGCFRSETAISRQIVRGVRAVESFALPWLLKRVLSEYCFSFKR